MARGNILPLPGLICPHPKQDGPALQASAVICVKSNAQALLATQLRGSSSSSLNLLCALGGSLAHAEALSSCLYITLGNRSCVWIERGCEEVMHREECSLQSSSFLPETWTRATSGRRHGLLGERPRSVQAKLAGLRTRPCHLSAVTQPPKPQFAPL